MNGYLDFLRAQVPAPVLVLGLGNTLLTDDGVGPALVEQLSGGKDQWNGQVEFVDGGTQGLALLGQFAGRRALIILDALTTGAAPGTIHRFTLPQLRTVTPVRGASAHEGNAGELLHAAELLGELPDRLFVVGVEPQEIRTGFGLSSSVKDALPDAARQVTHLLTQLC
jgi:hydrogenase maturation protease